MRARSISSLVLLALTSGCSPDEPPVAVAPPEEAAPPDLPAPSQATLDELLRETVPVRSDAPSQSVINSIRESTQVVDLITRLQESLEMGKKRGTAQRRSPRKAAKRKSA